MTQALSDSAVRPPGPRLILASASPRRADLLREAGYVFDIESPQVDEENLPPNLLMPSDVAKHLAERKAAAVSFRHPDAVVLGADTVVAFGDRILGKPADANDARQMLQLLAGTTHIVITGVAVMQADTSFNRSVRVMSAVRMRFLSVEEIERYVAGGDWQGKAGGYGIQDADLFPADHPSAAPFVVRHAGSRTNIVGLPMRVTKQLLSEAGVRPAGESKK